MIPKRIIQTDRNRQLRLLYQASVANMRLLNPDFEHCFFDNEEVVAFVAKEFPEYVEVFNSFPHPIQRYDFFRYLAVYRLGGFYFDLDVFLTRGLAPLLGHEAVFSYEDLTFNSNLSLKHGMYFEIGNFGFGCRAGHPFLKAVIENCVKGRRDPDWERRFIGGVPWLIRSQFFIPGSTGPGLVTRTLAEHPEMRPSVELLVPTELCEGARWRYFGDYGVHVSAGTWRRQDSGLRRFLARQLMKRLRRRLAPAWRSLPARIEVAAAPAGGVKTQEATP
jgi:hypothetical protein